MLVILGSAVVIVLAGALMLRRTGTLWSAPFLLGALVFVVLAVGGTTVFPAVSQFGPLYLRTRPFTAEHPAGILLLAGAGLLVGGLVTSGRGRPGEIVEFGPPRSERTRRTTVSWSLAVAWFGIALLLLGIGGPAAVLQRAGYADYGGPVIALSIGNALVPVSCGALGFSVSMPESRSRRPLIFATVLVAMLLSFSVGSRRLGVIVAVFWMGATLAQPTRRKFVLWLPVVAVLSVTLSGIAITLRQLPGSGLRPYASYFLAHPGGVYASVEGALANLLAPFAYNALSSRALPVDRGALLTSLSPLPSGLTNYSEIQSRLQFFVRHPYPALGTLDNYGGFLAVLVFMVVSGAVLGLAVNTVRVLSGRAAALGAVMLLALSVYFNIRLAEYSLRSASRIVWYLLFVTVAVRVVYFPHRLRMQTQQDIRATLASVTTQRRRTPEAVSAAVVEDVR